MVREGAGGERWPVVRSRLLLVVTHMLDSCTATNSGVTCKPVRQLDRECPGPSSGRSSRAPGGGGPPLRGLAGSGPAQGLQCRASSLVSVEGVPHVWFIGVQPPLSFGSASPLFSVFPFSLLPSLSFFFCATLMIQCNGPQSINLWLPQWASLQPDQRPASAPHIAPHHPDSLFSQGREAWAGPIFKPGLAFVKSAEPSGWRARPPSMPRKSAGRLPRWCAAVLPWASPARSRTPGWAGEPAEQDCGPGTRSLCPP